MATPRIALPPGVHSNLFDVVVRVLKNDPNLGRVVTTWRTWNGDPDEGNPPGFDEMPWVRITPTGDRSYLDTVGTHRSDLLLDFEYLVPSTRASDAMDLWAAIVRALFPGDGSVMRAIQAAGGIGYQVLHPGYSPGEVGDADKTLVQGGKCRMAIFVELDTLY